MRLNRIKRWDKQKSDKTGKGAWKCASPIFTDVIYCSYIWRAYIYMDQFTLRHRLWKGNGTRPNRCLVAWCAFVRVWLFASLVSAYLQLCYIVSRLGYLFAEKSHVTSLIRIAMIRGWFANNRSLMIAPTIKTTFYGYKRA